MPVRRSLLAVLIASTFVAAGCGAAPTPKPASPSAPATAKIGAGTVLTDALEDARCVRGDKPQTRKTWTARGSVKNTTDKTRDFEVLIHVGPAAQSVEARLVTVKGLAKGKSAEWQATGITPVNPNGPCFIRVRVAK